MAMTNISLDLFGQARSLYQYAAEIEGKGRTEDDIAYLRDGWDFTNCLLVEQPNGDFAHTIVRQFFFDVYQFYLYEALQGSSDETLAAIATKSLKETTYHLRFSREWMKRLGGGTEESHTRLQAALEKLWRYTDELCQNTPLDNELTQQNIGVDLETIKPKWLHDVNSILDETGLKLPQTTVMQYGGRKGVHTEHLGYILAEMQIIQRTYPGQEW
jgi:ring-1,2-phenylacetyl-CoA epoxidase subunit PaaC